jgi:hypothetical protein
MSGDTPPFPQYVFMGWCLVKAQGQLYLLPLPYALTKFNYKRRIVMSYKIETKKRIHALKRFALLIPLAYLQLKEFVWV